MRGSSAEVDARLWRVLAAIGKDCSLEHRLSAMLFTWCSSNQSIARVLRDPSFILESSQCSQLERGHSTPPHDSPAEATITTPLWQVELLDFLSDLARDLSRDRRLTRMLIVPFDREAATMTPIQNEIRFEMKEVVAAVEGIACHRTDNRTEYFLFMRCSFCEVALKYWLSVFDTAARVSKLNLDDRSFEEFRVRWLPVGSPRSTLISVSSGSRPTYVFDNTEAAADRAFRLIVGADTATTRRASSIKDKLSLLECLAFCQTFDILASSRELREMTVRAILALYLYTTSQDIHSNTVARFRGTGKLIFVIIDFPARWAL